MTTGYRMRVLGLIAVVLIGAAILDRNSSPSSVSDVETAGQPAAARPSAGSSAWYCAGATAAPNSFADGTVVVANAGTRVLNGTVTVIPAAGQTGQVPIHVAPATAASVHLSEVASSAFASAVVELDGGDAAVELATSGGLGNSVTPCASSASDEWFFAEGSTTKDAGEALMLFNPFPDDAVVNLVFSTDEGQVVPQALTGMTVRGQGMSVINVGEHVQRRAEVATSITAQRGRVVAARLQTFDGSAGRKGLSVALGSPSPAPVWYFPEGKVGQGLAERFQLFNPSKDEVTAEIHLVLDQGQAEPIIVAIPAESRTTVNANEEARIPKDVSHAVTVRTRDGALIVAERTIDAAAPASRAGLAIMPGALVPTKRSVFAVGQSDDEVEEWLVFQNAGTDPAAVSVTVLADGVPTAIPPLQNIEVPPGQRRAVRLTDAVQRAATPVVIESSQPVIVERDLFRIKGLGTSMTTGIPLGG